MAKKLARKKPKRSQRTVRRGELCKALTSLTFRSKDIWHSFNWNVTVHADMKTSAVKKMAWTTTTYFWFSGLSAKTLKNKSN